MNRIPNSEGQGNDDQDAIEAFTSLFKEAAVAQKERDAFGRAAKAAAVRLAKACYGHDNSQAVTVAAALASIYNGSDALGVRLDELRWLDWQLQRDLITVLIGTGHAGFEDHHIRAAFHEAGGDRAVEWFHWHITGGPQRAALKRLVTFIAEDRHCSSANTLRQALRSIYNGNTSLVLGRLSYLTDLGEDFARVLDGVIGRHSGTIREDAIEDAFKAAGILEALQEDSWPTSAAKK